MFFCCSASASALRTTGLLPGTKGFRFPGFRNFWTAIAKTCPIPPATGLVMERRKAAKGAWFGRVGREAGRLRVAGKRRLPIQTNFFRP